MAVEAKESKETKNGNGGVLPAVMLKITVALLIAGVLGAVASYAKMSAIEARVEGMDDRMDRIEDKLDRIIERGDARGEK